MLTPKQHDELSTFLRKNQDVFAWSTNDMPGISRSIAEHRLFVLSGDQPVQQ
jgi:hypothetical protein